MMATIIGREMDKKEKQAWESHVSKVTKLAKKNDPNLQAIVEGLLYIVGEDGLKLEQIALALDCDLEKAQTIIDKIADKYSSCEYGIELVNYASTYKFISKDFVFSYAQKLFQSTKPQALSQSALETLAIIAYKQPITRIEIEELRGVGCENMLRRLITRNLIKEAGRSEAPGRPIQYEVTDEFMDSFKLYTLNELPDLPVYDSEQENLFD